MRITLVASFLLLPISQASSAVKVGVTCAKIGAFQKTSQGVLVCDVVKKKKLWRKSTRIELSLYNKEQARIEAEKAQEIIDDAKAESDRLAQIAADKAAADAKAAADKAAADAKAAADKAAADAKAAADKAAADAKAAADKAAADKAAADAKAAADKAAAEARAAAEVPKLIVGQTYSGQDADNPGWRWVAVKVTNSATSKVFSHQFFDVYMANSSGAVVDKSLTPYFPIIGAGKSAWFTSTSFNTQPVSNVIFQQLYSTSPSPFLESELPTVSNVRLVTSSYYSTRKMVSFTLRNNSSKILSDGSQGFAVILDASNTPIYAVWGRLGVMVLPGGSTEITIGSDFTFNGAYSSIEVSIFPGVK